MLTTNCHQEPELSSARFADLDDYRDALGGWDVRFRQLDRGSFSASLWRIDAAGCQLSRHSYNRRLHQYGASPTGSLTFGIMGSNVAPISWCGFQADPESWEVFEADGEFDAVSQSDFDVITISIADARAAELAALLQLDDPISTINRQARTIRPGQGTTSALRLLVDTALSLARDDTCCDLELSELLNNEIPMHVLAGSCAARRLSSMQETHARANARRRALAYMNEHARERPNIAKICSEIGASWRLLDYAFRDHYGVSPKAYLNTIRLDGLRQDLKLAQVGASVTSLAADWGFTHHGLLAKDYRKRYGELPSKTLYGAGQN